MWIKHNQEWIDANLTVKNWLSDLSSLESQNVFGQAFRAFVFWTKKTPQQLLDLARRDKKNDTTVVLDLIKTFIKSGTYPDTRTGRSGVFVKVAETSKGRRQLYVTAIRSFFTHNRQELPKDKSWRIQENGGNIQTKDTFMELANARAIIGALKEPYRTLANVALYSGCGRKEALLLNKMWPQIKQQLEDGKDPIQLDFAKRKSNPKPYFTFIPAKLLRPFKDKQVPFSIYTKHGVVKRERPIGERDLASIWKSAQKRANVKGKQTFHMLRDLMVTSFYKIEADVTTAQFLTGHSIDSNQYLQISKAPERAVKEWQKYADYLDGKAVFNGRVKELENQVTAIKGLVAKATLAHDDQVRIDALNEILQRGKGGTMQFIDTRTLAIPTLIETLQNGESTAVARRKAQIEADKIIESA